MSELPIEAVAQWFARRADHDELPEPLLAEHLARLQQGRAVVDPALGHTLAPRRAILLETAKLFRQGLQSSQVLIPPPANIGGSSFVCVFRVVADR